MLRSFIIALQFLTRLPTPQLNEIKEQEIGHSLAWYPLVGLIIGGLLIGFSFLLNNIAGSISNSLHAALLLSFWILISGALHLDGLADSADAWLGGYGSKEKTLAIMKDPTSGPAAIVILILVLLTKFTALQSIIENNEWLVLLFAPLLARGIMLLLFQTTSYVRPGGLGEALAKHNSHMIGWILILILTAACVFLMNLKGIIILIAISTVFLLLRSLMKKRIGGITGDTAGAMIELIELTVLVSALFVPA